MLHLFGDEAGGFDDWFADKPLSADLHSLGEPRDSVCHLGSPMTFNTVERSRLCSVGQTVAKYFVKPVDCGTGGEGGILVPPFPASADESYTSAIIPCVVKA